MPYEDDFVYKVLEIWGDNGLGFEDFFILTHL